MDIILVSVDLSDVTHEVIKHAARLAADMACRLVLLHVGPGEADIAGTQLVRKVVDPEDVPPRLQERFEQVSALEKELSDRGIETESRIALGKPIDTILEEARRAGAELIVMGSHRRSAMARLLGSVSEGVLRGSECPVLIVPTNRRV